MQNLPHVAHKWREGLFNQRQMECPGIPFEEKAAWERANPNIGIAVSPNTLRTMAGLEPHKHHLKLTKWSWASMAPFGMYDQICVLGFTCLDEDCTFQYDMYRWEYDKLVLKSGTKIYEWRT